MQKRAHSLKHANMSLFPQSRPHSTGSRSPLGHLKPEAAPVRWFAEARATPGPRRVILEDIALKLT